MKWIVARLSRSEFGAWIIVHTCSTKKKALKYVATHEHFHPGDTALACKVESFDKLGFTFKFPGEWFKIVLGLFLPSYYYADKCLIDVRYLFGVPYIMERREDFL